MSKNASDAPQFVFANGLLSSKWPKEHKGELRNGQKLCKETRLKLREEVPQTAKERSLRVRTRAST
jgi:hypothetical protein